jgi:hypothetical protein
MRETMPSHHDRDASRLHPLAASHKLEIGFLTRRKVKLTPVGALLLIHVKEKSTRSSA